MKSIPLKGKKKITPLRSEHRYMTIHMECPHGYFHTHSSTGNGTSPHCSWTFYTNLLIIIMMLSNKTINKWLLTFELAQDPLFLILYPVFLLPNLCYVSSSCCVSNVLYKTTTYLTIEHIGGIQYFFLKKHKFVI